MEKENEAVKEYEEMGIEFESGPITPTAEEKEPEPEPVAEKPVVEKPVVEAKESEEGDDNSNPDNPEPPEPQVPKKRTIYTDYKEKKQELKSERELREKAEQERDELKAKLEAKEKGDVSTVDPDIKAYAEKVGADPEALQEMRDVILKGVKPVAEIPKEFKDNMEALEKWKAQNSEASETLAFNSEFDAAKPTIKKTFPTVSDEGMEKIKNKIKELAHTEKYHDKELDYVIFKEQDTLMALVSPKKAGIEGKGRVDNTPIAKPNFDPNADISKMTPKESEEWEKEYDRLSNSPESLTTDGNGKKIFI